MTLFVISIISYFLYILGLSYNSYKGLVKLIKWVEITHSFLQSVSNQFHVIILSLPM